MIKTNKKTSEFIKVHIEVGMAHVHDAASADACQDPSKCMEKLALHAQLEKEFGRGKVKKVRIDGAQIKFTAETADGWHRWAGLTPKSAKNNLIKFDAWTKRLKKNPDEVCPIQPHAYTATLEKGVKVQPNSPERQAKINKARKARLDAGLPDKKYHKTTTHDRVMGMASI